MMAPKTTERRQSCHSWPKIRVGDICRLINGKAFKPSDWDTEGLPIIRIQNLNNAEADFNYWSGTLDRQVLVSKGDVLFAWSGTPGTSFGAHIWNSEQGVLNQHIFKVILSEDRVMAEWFVAAMNHTLEDLIAKAHGGVGLRHVNKSEVEALELPLPPLPEQKRIAAILKEQMAAVEKARVAAEEQLEAAEALEDSYLRSIFPSFESTLPDGWRWETLDELCRDVSDGSHFTPTYLDKGVPFLSVKDISPAGINFDDCRFISEDEHIQLCNRCCPKRGDVLYTKVGTTGIAKAIDIDDPFSIFVSVALLKVTDQIVPTLLQYTLNSPVCRQQADALTQGMANRNLVIRDIKRILVPVAPISEQSLLLKRVETNMALVAKAKNAVAEQFAEISALPGSILRKAFNGEL